MGMKIIEVALALVTIYLVMALAATQLVELSTAAFNRRPRVLKAIVSEAFGGQAGLVDEFFSYAPIYALSKGKRRPAAIPPDLFATAFLAVLNGKKPPRADFRTPAEFVAAAKPAGQLVQVLAAQLAGAEADWDAFEQRIARWYSDICDRAEGWYKRETTLWLLGISALLAFVLNADSAYIARTLLQNDTLRVSIADIGELLLEQRNQEQGGVTGTPAPSTDRLSGVDDTTARTLVSGDLDRALGEMRAALDAAPTLGAYGDSVGTDARRCLDDANTSNDNNDKDDNKDKYKSQLYDSNYEAWTHLVASIISKVDMASLGVSRSKPFLQETQSRIDNIRQAMVCTSAISTWVRNALGERKHSKAEPHLTAAIVALDSATRHMQALVDRSSFPNNLARSYALLGQDFVDCANAAGKSRAAFERCIESARTTSLPFGWPGQAGQFCRMRVYTPGERLPDAGARPAHARPAANRDLEGMNAWFGCQDYEGNSMLDLPVIQAKVVPAKLLAVFLGWVSTAVLVSLGAPFWYGVLSKVARLRIAGRVRGLDQVPEAGATSGTAAGRGSVASRDLPAAPPAPFDSALNEYERAMPPKEISRLQNALGVPPTMQLNEVTRNAIAARLEALGQSPDRELTPSTYYMIVGRNPAQATVDTPSAAVWSVGTRDPVAVPQVADALNRLFPHVPPRFASGDTFTHDLRAGVVLYRFKSDPAALIRKPILKMAASPNGELMRLDDATRRTLLASVPSPAFDPDPRPWLDHAYGELGVTEASAEGLQRIEEYLTTVGGQALQGQAASTSWCGGFAGWVLYRAGKFPDGAPRPHLLEAHRWRDYGTATTGSPGDICIVDNYHVGFLIEIDGEGRHWLLGGNQGNTGLGTVSLVSFKAINRFTYVPIGSVH